MSKYVVYSGKIAVSCNSVTDCYAAGKLDKKTFPAATTDAEKAKRCCVRQEFTKLPPADNKFGQATLSTYKSGGLTTTVGEYTQVCEYQKELAGSS